MSHRKQLYAVIGQPIFFSRSPQLYNLAFRELKIDAAYVRLAGESLQEVMRTAEELDLSGFNVTSPYKEKIIFYLDSLDEKAAAIGAVNTVVREKGWLKGYNTDPDGLEHAVGTMQKKIKGHEVLVWGAGGAARAALYALKEMGAGSVWITNRTRQRGKRLADEFGLHFLSTDKALSSLPRFKLIVACIPHLKELGAIVSSAANSCQPGTKNSTAIKRPPGVKVLAANYHYSERNNKEKINKKRDTHMLTSGLMWLFGQGVKSLEIYTGRKIGPALQKKLRTQVFKAGKNKKNLALIGFMGAGKSAVGRELADRLGWDFLDTDELIEAKSGLKIEAIFERYGESYFRQLEKVLLPPFLERASHLVFALGGGAILNSEVKSSLRNSSNVVWLWSSFEEIMARTRESDRPLAKGKNKEKIEALLRSRIPLYATCSDLVVANRPGKMKDTMRLIHEEISPAFSN